MEQDEIKKNKEEYIQAQIKKYGYTEKEISYYNKYVLTAARLSGGELIKIEKLSIKKRFCYGHGMNGISTEDEQKSAYDASRKIKESERIFTNENARESLEAIKYYQKYRADDKYTYGIVVTQGGVSHIDFVSPYSVWPSIEAALANYNLYEPTTARRLVKEDIQALISAYQLQLEDIKKRCAAYWKRHGGSKLTTWTYLID